MKNIILLTFVLSALILSACAAPAATETSISAPIVTEAPMEEHTEAPASTDAPVIAPTPAPATGNEVPVQITLGDNWIESDTTTFKVGVTYRFTITNTGNRTHNFNISKPAELNTNAIRAALENALLHVPDEQLRSGSVVTIDFTFTDPAPAGTLEFACLIERHYKSGQFLPIVVEP
jgi:uncharacterized cupredoxin-like copper-binding protein